MIWVLIGSVLLPYFTASDQRGCKEGSGGREREGRCARGTRGVGLLGGAQGETARREAGRVCAPQDPRGAAGARTGNSVAVHVEEEMRVDLDVGKTIIKAEHKALARAEVVTQERRDVDELGLGQVVAVGELLSHRLREHGVECALQLGREVLQPLLERLERLLRHLLLHLVRVLHVELDERLALRNRREHAVLDLVPRKAIRLFVLFAADRARARGDLRASMLGAGVRCLRGGILNATPGVMPCRNEART